MSHGSSRRLKDDIILPDSLDRTEACCYSIYPLGRRINRKPSGFMGATSHTIGASP